MAGINKTNGDKKMDDVYVIMAMSKNGGGFIKALADAFRKADAFNRKRLKDAFPDYWKRYEEFAKHDAEGSNR